MSIEDDSGRAIVTMGTVNAWAFKIAIWFAPVFAIWMVTKVMAHDTDIAVLKMQMAMQGGNGRAVSQNVNVGQRGTESEAQDSARTWLTTKEVAAREKVTERTVINYIERGMIDPPPVLNGKAWQIAESFRIIPKDSESCGNEQSP